MQFGIVNCRMGHGAVIVCETRALRKTLLAGSGILSVGAEKQHAATKV